jgi:hypothetical protein
VDEGPRNQFFSTSEDRGLIRQFFDENQPATGDVQHDAAAMEGIVNYVIQRTRNPLVGGIPVVAVLEYGKPERWSAAAEVCRDHQK